MASDETRSLASDVASSAAEYRGIPFDAICTGCQQVAVKRAAPEEVGFHPQIDPRAIEISECHSFKHVCHDCGRATFWNPLRVLEDLLDEDEDEDGEGGEGE